MSFECDDVESEGIFGAASLAPRSMEKPYSVFEITSLIKEQLEGLFSQVALVGEISNFKAHSSGHFYFSLKDEKAAISAVMFRGSNAQLKFLPKDGQKVIGLGKVTVYPPRGNYQIVLSRMMPEGMGELQLAFEQLKEKLKAAGLFEDEHKKPIPKFPRCVGVVTSPTGAAIQDILNVLGRRFSGLRVLIFPARVQGDGAAKEIAESIDWANQFFPEIETLIVGRGGGSLEDLWAFNEEIVARSIFESKIPVISAVGHEVDFSIADFVADLRAPTPSAAAELVVSSQWEALRHVENLTQRLTRIVSKLENTQLRVDDLHQKLMRSLGDKLGQLSLRLEKARSRLNQNSPFVRLKDFQHRWSNALSRMQVLLPQRLERVGYRVESLKTKLRLLNPKEIMSRGYSIVRLEDSRRVVTKAADVQMGDKLLIELHKGQIKARV